MLTITVPGIEVFDEGRQEFATQGDMVLELEHSLVSLSKWEAIFEKPFLGDADKTTEEIYGYIQAMCLTPGVPNEIFSKLSNENAEAVNAYINARMSATWFSETPGAPKTREVITSELVTTG